MSYIDQYPQPDRVRFSEVVREVVSPDVVELLRKTGLVYVSGLPSIRTEPPTFYSQNEHVSNIPFIATSATVIELPPQDDKGNALPISANITPEFLGRYAVLNGFNPDDDVQYVFPIRAETHFNIRPR